MVPVFAQIPWATNLATFSNGTARVDIKDRKVNRMFSHERFDKL
jgi:hypothetical protein